MASYIPWYGKKRQRLAEHEREFAALLREESGLERLAEGAKAVRAAQVRALKAIQAQLPPSEKYADALADLDQKIRFWSALTDGEIVEIYRTGKLKATDSIARRRRSPP